MFFLFFFLFHEFKNEVKQTTLDFKYLNNDCGPGKCVCPCEWFILFGCVYEKQLIHKTINWLNMRGEHKNII